MMELVWYFEQRGMTGNWSPCLAAEKPSYVVKDGVARATKAEGRRPAIRAVQKVPKDLRGLTLNELHKRLTTEAIEVTEPAAQIGGAA